VEVGKYAASLLPVIVSATGSAGLVERQQAVSQVASVPPGAIHIEFSGRVAITVEHGADRAALQAILESLRKCSRCALARASGLPRV
jgi:hypothetical protein